MVARDHDERLRHARGREAVEESAEGGVPVVEGVPVPATSPSVGEGARVRAPSRTGWWPATGGRRRRSAHPPGDPRVTQARTRRPRWPRRYRSSTALASDVAGVLGVSKPPAADRSHAQVHEPAGVEETVRYPRSRRAEASGESGSVRGPAERRRTPDDARRAPRRAPSMLSGYTAYEFSKRIAFRARCERWGMGSSRAPYGARYIAPADSSITRSTLRPAARPR